VSLTCYFSPSGWQAVDTKPSIYLTGTRHDYCNCRLMKLTVGNFSRKLSAKCGLKLCKRVQACCELTFFSKACFVSFLLKYSFLLLLLLSKTASSTSKLRPMFEAHVNESTYHSTILTTFRSDAENCFSAINVLRRQLC
jgi:hypothetical protein